MIFNFLLDLETNGLIPGFHEISQFTIIEASSRTHLTRNVIVEHPENSSFDALRITGKTIEDLKQGIPKFELINEVEEFISHYGATPAHRCLIGHNIIGFDRRFLCRLYEDHNKILPFDLFLDTMHLIRAYIKENGIQSKANLQASCDLLGIKKAAGQHNSLSDSKNCYFLWKELVDNRKINYLPHIKNMPHIVE